MTVDRFVHAFAGAMVLVSLALAHVVSPWFFLLTAFVGVNLVQTAFTRFCPLAFLLRRAGVRDPVPEDARSL